ncbi:MAG: endonuclease/exonuclease/phosphatase family protein [Nitriliruptoraceae bacterium]
MTVAQHRRPVLGTAAVTFVLIELQRVLLPSAVLVWPQNSRISTLGAIGVTMALVLAPIAIATTIGRITARTVWKVAGSTLLGARIVLWFEPGGTVLLVTAAVGVVAGLTAIVALTAGSSAARPIRVGVVIGFAAEACLRVATLGLGLPWSTGPWAQFGGLIVVAVLAAALPRTVGRPVAGSGQEQGPPAWPWWWLTPAFALTGMLTAVPGRVAVATGWGPSAVAITIAGAHVGAVLAAMFAPRMFPSRVAPLGAGLTLIGTAAALPATGWLGVAGPVAAAVGLGALAGAGIDDLTSTSPRSRALVTAAALGLAGVLSLGYYAVDLLPLPGNNRLLLLALAGGAAVLGTVIARHGAAPTVQARLRPMAGARSITAAVIVVLLVGLVTRPPVLQPLPTDDERLTVATYNVRSGFGLDGRYDPVRQAQVLREHEVDLVLLNEVDRGWWVHGGQDLLPLFAAELGFEHVRFAPATDEVHGHALLSRYPIAEFVTEPLPAGVEHTARSHLGAVVVLPGDIPLGVVGTQLASGPEADAVRLRQARSVAGTVARLRERQVPTVLLGDLGAPADSPAIESFDPLLHNALPQGTRTYPAPAPTHQRDHILLSPDLRRSQAWTPHVTASEHLPVVIRVIRVPLAM